ncbi:hypothetical protein L6V77_15615 [Myxococcota bacterium]|jgi:hypothetical protein|nr:hypothetical protein [Myxococcota bacterium]
MRTPTRPAALLVMTVVFSFAATFTGCWGPVDKGQPGVRNRVTAQGQGAEWIKLRTELDGKSPVSGPAASAAPAAH